MKERELQKSQFSNCLVNREIYGSIYYANVQKFQFSISSMNWEKLKRPAKASFKNSNFQSLCQLEKIWKFSLRPRFQSPNFEFIYELGKVLM